MKVPDSLVLLVLAESLALGLAIAACSSGKPGVALYGKGETYTNAIACKLELSTVHTARDSLLIYKECGFWIAADSVNVLNGYRR